MTEQMQMPIVRYLFTLSSCSYCSNTSQKHMVFIGQYGMVDLLRLQPVAK